MENLTLKDIQNFADTMHNRFIQRDSLTLREMTYARMVKVTEEVGEMADAVLSSFKHQRIDKQNTACELGAEMADVILAVSILARGMNVDIEESLRQKMDKILKREL